MATLALLDILALLPPTVYRRESEIVWHFSDLYISSSGELYPGHACIESGLDDTVDLGGHCCLKFSVYFLNLHVTDMRFIVYLAGENKIWDYFDKVIAIIYLKSDIKTHFRDQKMVENNVFSITNFHNKTTWTRVVDGLAQFHEPIKRSDFFLAPPSHYVILCEH